MPTDVAAAGGRFITADRGDFEQLNAALGGGAQLLVDCICYTAADAARCVPLAARRRVDRDDLEQGGLRRRRREPLEHARLAALRRAGPRDAADDGSGRRGLHDARRATARTRSRPSRCCSTAACPVTVLRPSKIHGAGGARPREWVFVKRILDRRPAVFLAHRGAGTDQTTAAANIAALVATVATKPGRRILNSADPDAPSALQIVRTIARQLDHVWDEVLLDDDADETLGRHPGTPGTRSCST